MSPFRYAALVLSLSAACLPAVAQKGGHGHSSKSSSSGSESKSTEHVSGYTRKNGTYVAPHDRTTPDASKTNNWSTKGNVNPETGKKGEKNPY